MKIMLVNYEDDILYEYESDITPLKGSLIRAYDAQDNFIPYRIKDVHHVVRYKELGLILVVDIDKKR